MSDAVWSVLVMSGSVSVWAVISGMPMPSNAPVIAGQAPIIDGEQMQTAAHNKQNGRPNTREQVHGVPLNTPHKNGVKVNGFCAKSQRLGSARTRLNSKQTRVFLGQYLKYAQVWRGNYIRKTPNFVSPEQGR